MSQSVTIVTVAYNSAGILNTMLGSVPDGTPVVVVDNGSRDVAALQILCAQHGAQLVTNTANLGFGTACNQGATLAKTDYVFFLNPDAQLDANTLDALVRAGARYPRASAFNPRIVNPDGSGFFKRSSRLMPRAERMPRGCPAADTEVTVLSGAAMFVRRSDFEAVGGFDERIFLYHEDDDLARRLRRDRGPLMFVSEPVVRHIGGGSSEPSLETTALKAFHLARSRVYTTRKHHRPLPFARAAFSAVQGLFAPDMLTSPRRRAKNWAYFKGVLSTVRDGGAAARPSHQSAQ